MAVLGVAEGDGFWGFNHSPIKRIDDSRNGPRMAGSHAAVSLNAGILALPGEFVTREIPRICRGFSLADRANQTEEMPLSMAKTPSGLLMSGLTMDSWISEFELRLLNGAVCDGCMAYKANPSDSA